MRIDGDLRALTTLFAGYEQTSTVWSTPTNPSVGMTWPGASSATTGGSFYPWHETTQVGVGPPPPPPSNPKSFSPPYQLPLAPLEYHHHHYASSSPLPLGSSCGAGELSPYHHQLQPSSQQGSPPGGQQEHSYDSSGNNKEREEVGIIKWSPLTPPPTQPGLNFGLKIEGN